MSVTKIYYQNVWLNRLKALHPFFISKRRRISIFNVIHPKFAMDIIEIKMKIKWTLKHEISVFDIYLFTEILKIKNNVQNLYHQIRMKMIEINPVSIQYQIKSIAKTRMENSYSNQQSILRQYFQKNRMKLSNK